MNNHVHLAVQVGDISLSKIMQNLSFRYTQYSNRKQNKTGHLFQGRYKAILVDADDYLLELVRYIHLNPYRVGLVSEVDDLQWTSHASYAENLEVPLLTTDWVLSQFGSDVDSARARYRKFIQDGMWGQQRGQVYA
jgi:hypothetical protein